VSAEQLELLKIEEADAWFEYLYAIRESKLGSKKYEDVEPWAWARRSIAAARRRAERVAA
jgi:hypothetical protein